MLGKLIGGVVRLVNVPVKIGEALIDTALDDPGASKELVGLSEPLDKIADNIEESLDGEDYKRET
jgi:hypothetical protein